MRATSPAGYDDAVTMPASSRNERLRARREECATLSELAVEFGLSKTRIVQILERTGGDPMAAGRRLDLRDVPVAQLEAEASRLAARVAAARRRLQILRDEMSARQTDRILGLE